MLPSRCTGQRAPNWSEEAYPRRNLILTESLRHPPSLQRLDSISRADRYDIWICKGRVDRKTFWHAWQASYLVIEYGKI